MITSNLVDAKVHVRTPTRHDPSSAFFKLCFRLWEWSKCYATHMVFATLTAVTVANAPGILDYEKLKADLQPYKLALARYLEKQPALMK
ncbi:hypothetical protein PoB_002133600 [Plakobranchus ocellatus]|uniref:Uncharacterized protein n=1 Tax=Plakobranchus ocellatus TaxID=259542 RepID=A0AAV3ZFZ6_9GAST|nr:hypothetical protein PoB_002133600 [Plakobranchus ocellatus]